VIIGKKSKNAKEPVLAVVEVEPQAAEAAAAADGWITVKDKKTKKSNSIVEISAPPQAETAPVAPEPTPAAPATVATADSSSWTTVNSKSKKEKKVKPQISIPQMPSPVEDKTEVFITPIVIPGLVLNVDGADNEEAKEEEDWIPANNKAVKKSKPKVAAAAVVEVPVALPQAAPVKPAPEEVAPVVAKEGKKKNKKEAAATKTVVETPDAETREPVPPVALTSAIPKNSTAEAIQAAINNVIDSNSGSSDINNNSNKSKKPTGPSSLVNNDNNKNNYIANLKQTNLSESMILIEKDSPKPLNSSQSSASSSNSKSSRTESNQSSSDSLQDVEGDVEGFITITNKKTKKPVRRD
jgi:hypothetical protein